MSRRVTHLTADLLRELLHYNPETGAFTWLKTMGNGRIPAGCEAGTTIRGYRRIHIGGKVIGAHRIAWLYVHGDWPAHQIDHINGNKTDNRIANLRDATSYVNAQNIRGPRKDNTSGVLGVSLDKSGKWAARVRHMRKLHHFGLHATKEEAHAAYVAGKRLLHEGCTL